MDCLYNFAESVGDAYPNFDDQNTFDRCHTRVAELMLLRGEQNPEENGNLQSSSRIP